MKKFSAFFMLIAACLITVPASAFQLKDDTVNYGAVKEVKFSTGFTVTKSGGVHTIVTNPTAITSAVFEGATADAFETTIAAVDPTADNTATLPDASGTFHLSTAATALTAGTTVAITVKPGRSLFTFTPTDNENSTFNASGAGTAGDEMTILFTTDAAGSGDEVMTFGTNMLSTGTLTLANVAADLYSVTWVSNGTKWVEKSRTAVQTT